MVEDMSAGVRCGSKFPNLKVDTARRIAPEILRMNVSFSARALERLAKQGHGGVEAESPRCCAVLKIVGVGADITKNRCKIERISYCGQKHRASNIS